MTFTPDDGDNIDTKRSISGVHFRLRRKEVSLRPVLRRARLFFTLHRGEALTHVVWCHARPANNF